MHGDGAEEAKRHRGAMPAAENPWETVHGASAKAWKVTKCNNFSKSLEGAKLMSRNRTSKAVKTLGQQGNKSTIRIIRTTRAGSN